MVAAFTALGPDPTSAKSADSRSQACLDLWYVFIHVFMISCISDLKAFSPGQLRLVKNSIFIFLGLLRAGFSYLSISCHFTYPEIHCLAFSCHSGITEETHVLCCICWSCTDVLGHLKWHYMFLFRQANPGFDNLYTNEFHIEQCKLKFPTKKHLKIVTSCYFF